ncbi:hypothetical protein [Streptomyces nojiriensis]|uniref:hypothetical protein n=1 Tax=Streptomyces nojiriensis TaxID=66374 RepID=UPI00365EEDD1
MDPAIAEAVERQTAAMRELFRRAFPEPEVVADDAPAPIEQVRLQRRRQAAVTEAATLRRARAEKAGMLPRDTARRWAGPRRVAPRSEHHRVPDDVRA